MALKALGNLITESIISVEVLENKEKEMSFSLVNTIQSTSREFFTENRQKRLKGLIDRRQT